MIQFKASEHCCEEASPLSTDAYIPCNKPAMWVVHSPRDNRNYRMCDPCAHHNVERRGCTFIGEYNRGSFEEY